jgi:hypothetical protein
MGNLFIRWTNVVLIYVSASYLCNIQVIWLQQGGNGATHVDYIQKRRWKLLPLTGPPNYWEIRDKGMTKADETHLFYLLVLCGLLAVARVTWCISDHIFGALAMKICKKKCTTISVRLYAQPTNRCKDFVDLILGNFAKICPQVSNP